MTHVGGSRSAVFMIVIFLTMIAMSGCPQKETSLSGQIVIPQGETLKNTSIAAMLNGNEAASAQLDPATGKYKIILSAPGTYDLRLKTPLGNLDFASGVTVAKGQQATAESFPAPVDLFESVAHISEPATTVSQQAATNMKPVATEVQQTGALTSLKGSIYPPEAGVKVMAEGKVVAQAKAKAGTFEIPSVPVGLYDVEYSAPGYATYYVENVAVVVEGSPKSLNAYLVYQSPIDGIDWQKGTVTATGIGKPNPGMAQPQAGLMACQAAKTIAYRNLLNELLQIQVAPGKTIKSIDSKGTMVTQLEGYIQGARVINEVKNADGTCEMTLQMSVYGPSGVTEFIQTHIGK